MRIPQETLEFELNRQIKTFSFSPTIIFFEEGKCLLAVPGFEETNSVFNNTEEKIVFQFQHHVIFPAEVV